MAEQNHDICFQVPFWQEVTGNTFTPKQSMPTYLYRRKDGSTFEIEQKITEPALINCPTTGQSVTRLISGGAGLVFKGSGFYITDYARNGKSPSSEKKSEPASKSTDSESSKAKSEDSGSSSGDSGSSSD